MYARGVGMGSRGCKIYIAVGHGKSKKNVFTGLKVTETKKVWIKNWKTSDVI